MIFNYSRVTICYKQGIKRDQIIMNEKVYNALFGARVKYYREKKGMTQKELAEKLGYTTHTSIYQIESGNNSIPLSKLPDFCLALDVEPFDLLGLTEKDKQIQIIAEKMESGERASDIAKFVELYMKLLGDK